MSEKHKKNTDQELVNIIQNISAHYEKQDFMTKMLKDVAEKLKENQIFFRCLEPFFISKDFTPLSGRDPSKPKNISRITEYVFNVCKEKKLLPDSLKDFSTFKEKYKEVLLDVQTKINTERNASSVHMDRDSTGKHYRADRK